LCLCLFMPSTARSMKKKAGRAPSAPGADACCQFGAGVWPISLVQPRRHEETAAKSEQARGGGMCSAAAIGTARADVPIQWTPRQCQRLSMYTRFGADARSLSALPPLVPLSFSTLHDINPCIDDSSEHIEYKLSALLASSCTITHHTRRSSERNVRTVFTS
jgi:hypothetical protein